MHSTYNWVDFSINALVCYILFVKTLLFNLYYSRTLRDTKCVSFFCTPNWAPFQREDSKFERNLNTFQSIS